MEEVESNFYEFEAGYNNVEYDWRNNSYYYYYMNYDMARFEYLNETMCSLAFTAASLNLIIIAGICSIKGSLKTQMKLLLSLSISDCIVAILHFVQYFYMVLMVSIPHIPDIIDIALMSKCSIMSVDMNISSYTFYIEFILKQILASLYIIARIAGIGTMILLSIDVLIKVWKPLNYNFLMSKRRGNIVTTCIWLISSAAVAVLLGTTCKSDTLGFWVIIYYIETFFSVLYLPLFVFFIVIYMIIFRLIKRYLRRQPSPQQSGSKKSAVTIFLILLSFFLCVLPGAQVIVQNDDNDKYGLFDIVYLLNYSMDPIIFAFRIPEIRRSYTAIWNRVVLTFTTPEQ